jgi:hypothetical protein
VRRLVWVQYRRVGETKQYSLVLAREASAALICAASPGPCIRVSSSADLAAAARTHTSSIVFADFDLLPLVACAAPAAPIVGIIDEGRSEPIRSLISAPWLSHLVTGTMLAAPGARSHLEALHDRIEFGPTQHAIGATGVGRAALLGNSARREARFERMREFFATQGISERMIASSSDVAEELVTNALYDAPVEAGYFQHPIQRTEDVKLPPEHACEISYGVEHGSVFIRVRDPFGALTRTRLLGVLNRCQATSISLDESRGGAGLGLWRIFSTASSIAITVIPGSLTDIMVRIETRRRRAGGKALHAVHLFFPDEQAMDGAQGRFAADHDHDLMDDSFTAMYVA